MLKRIKLENSTIIFIGVLLILTGLFIGFYQYFVEKKDKAFSDMNILLYENEMPKNIEDDEENPVVSSPEPTPDPEPEPDNGSNDNYTPIRYEYDGILEIPKINLRRGFPNINSWYNNVDYNITVINGSTMPDEQNNNLILAAHSGGCSYCYFDYLYRLSIGDIANVIYKGYKYSYSIVNIYEVEKTGTVAIHRDHSKNVLTLITCTRGSNTKQTVYILELISAEEV